LLMEAERWLVQDLIYGNTAVRLNEVSFYLSSSR
jgi:hypothetical protein